MIGTFDIRGGLTVYQDGFLRSRYAVDQARAERVRHDILLT